MAGYSSTAAYVHAGEREYLQAYEDVLERHKDERDRVQKKTFAKWINQHLMKVRKHVNDLYEDLRDGHNLISLLEVLSGQTLPREKGRMRFHRLQNVQIALDYLKKRQVKLVNIRNDDITDGNPKLTLGLIWTIILHFQISDIHVPGVPGDMTAKEKLLLWSQQTTESYVGVRCENFTTCWRDGRLFNAIIHKYRPDLIDMNMVATQSSRSNLEQAFCVAEQLGVTRLLDPEDVDVQSPDEKSVITYVSILYDVFPKIPEGEEGITAHDVDIKWVEYQNMVNYLSQWIRHHLTIMSDRTFPNNPVELKALYNQYLQFKETEIPPKENDKTRIKHLYKLLESWIEFGRIKLPQEYHPNDVEREWGKLIIAMLEREKSLRPEVDRLEMLQQIASRVQRDCVAGEDKLVLARNALQSDAKRLESGIQFQNEAEIAGYLLECESLLRQQVVDIQILLDGKYYLADQLVQRVSKLRDDFLALKSECSSVYSRGRTLTTEQTKMMISGITQSLNSGFSQNMNPGLNTGLSQGLTPTLTSGLLPCLSPGLTSSFTSSLTPCLTPSLTPAMTPGLQPAMVQGYVTGMDSTALQSLKLMQIRKPLVKSSLADPNLTEEEVNMNFVQDLLNWVEEMQVQLDRSEWGSDLPTVETHLENHKSVHRAIEDFQMSLKEAKFSEIQMTSPHKYNYSERLSKLENQYGKLLNSSRNRQKYLESLHEFVSRATREIIWLNEKEEEEVAYDWSDRNSNMAKKRDYHADLMRELDEKERAIKSVQDMAERLLLENHPAKLTIEAYRAAMQTQWSWILQLCGCVEQHLKENAVYFEFFNDAKESMDYLNNLQDTIQRKYGCDRTSNLHKLEDLIKESMDEKEQLLQYRSTVASLVGRAKGIAQLKPRNPDGTIRCSIPVKAICDYRQIEITIFKEDECVLASNSYRAKWKVISPNGNEAMVPSVCFTIPPPNKEAIETVSRIEQLYQNVLTLWHHSHINMKSVVSWHYLMNDIEAIQNSNVASIKTMLPGEHQQVLSNLQSHFEDFLEDSQESEVFTVSDRGQLEREVVICKQYYEDLLKSAEREEHEESVYNLFISEVRNFRMRLENYEERLIRQIRAPLERDDLQESVLRIAEQEKSKKELDRLKEDLETMQEKCETFISQAASTPSVPTLSTELNVVVQNMNQVYSMSSIYLEKLKTVSRVVKNSQGAEALVRLYEAKLCEEDAVNAETKAIETVVSTLKLWCTEIDEKREVFHDLEDELQKARAISDRMFKMHNERDFDLDWHKEKADQLAERWQNVHSQIENRLRDLECTCKSLKYYKDTYHALDEWIKEMEDTQLKMQENQPEDSKALAELLNQQKVLVSEIEMKQSKIDECQKYSEQYSAVVKDYELQLMTYRAMVDSQQKSPVKRRRMQSSSDVIQEFMDLRTRYTALVTLMTQYVKFASETLKRTEEEEYSSDEGELYPPMETEYASNEPVNIGRSVKNAVPTALPIETAGTNKRDLPILTNTHEDGSFPATEKKENERDSSPFEAVMQDTSSIPECSNYIFPMDTIKGTIGVADSAVSPESTVVPKKEHTQGLKKKSRKAAGTKQNKCCPATCIEDQEENRSILTEITSGSKDPGVYSRALQTQLVAQVPLEKSAQVSVRKAYQGQDNQASEVKISDFEEKGGPQSNLPTNVDSQNISNTFGDEIQFNMGEYYPEQYADIQVVKTDENAEIVSHRSSSLMQNNNSTTIDLNSVLQIFEEGDELSCYQKDLVSRERKMCRKPEKHHDTVLCVIKDTSSFTVSDEDITDEITVEYLGMMKDQQPLSGSFSVAKAEESLDTNSTVSAVRFDRVLSNKEHIFKRPGVTLKDEALDHQFSQETDHEEGRHLQSGTNRPHTSTETADNKHPTDARMEKEGKTVKDTIGVYNKATLIMDSRQQKTEGISYKESITCGIKDKLLENQPVKDEHFIEITSPEQKASKSTAGQSAYEGEGTRSFMSDSIGQYIELTGQRNLLKKLKEGEVMTKAFKQSQISTEHQRLENEAHLKDNKEKSVEEEKKEHGEKVSKLLNWASNMKKTNIKEEKLLQDEKNVTKDTSYKPQVSMEEVATKKEQIAEALRTTQLMLVKHSDKMTEEERQDTKEQLKSLQQAYNDLSRQSVNQLPQPQSLPAEQDYQTIEGLIDLETGAVFSVCRSMQKGLIDYTTGINLLEAQLITSGLILPELSVCLDLDDAFKHGLVDKHTYNHLQEMNGAKRCILSAKYASEPLPLIAAWRDGIISEQLAIRMIEIQLATGGLRVTYTGDILNLEKAFQSGLIPPPLFLKILEREDTCTDLIDPNTAERVSLIQLVQRSLVHEETGLRLLPVKKGEDGKIALKSGREVSILRAVHEGLIDRETMFRLLGAQLFAGGIMDPTTNSKLNVKEAVQEGLIDQDTACKILSYQAQNGGIVNPCTGDRLTMDEAVQCNLITSSSALLVLEKQKAFMGLIWPCSGEIFTVSTSIQHEVITNELAYKLLSNRQKIAALYIPESSEVVSIEDATKSEIIDSNTADVLNSIVIPDVIPDIDDLDEKIATWVSSCDLQLVSSHESQQNQEISELKNTNLPSSSEAKQLFISYLMINSYMDPKLGQRLLVYDRELAKITTLFTENAEKSHNTMPCLKQSSVSLDKHDCNEAVENRVSEQSVGRHENRTDKEPNTMPNQHFPRQVQEQFISRLHDCFSEETESYKHSDNKTQVDNAEVYNTMNCSEDGVEKQTHISADRYVAVLPSITKDQSQIQFQTPNHHLITNANIEGQEHLCNQKHMIETGLDGPHTYKEIAMGSDTKETVLDGDFDMLPHMRECSLYKDVKCNSFASVSSDINDKVSKIPNDCESQKADLEFSGKTGIFTKGLGNDEEENLLLLKDVEKGKLEQQNAANILKVQLEECGILDYATGERYDLDTALEKGLVGKDTILDVLALQFQDGGINDEQTGETLPLKEDVAKGLIPSHVGLQIEEKLGLLDRFYESKTGETITINDAIQQGLVDNDVIEKALLSEKVIYATIDPESNDLHSVPEGAVFSLLNDSTAQRLLEGQVLSGGIVDLEQGKQVSVTLASKLGLINEQLGEGLLKTEEAITGKEVDDSIKLKQMGLQMELSGMQDPEVQQPLPLTEAIEKARVDKDTAPSILCKQLEDGGIVQHASGLCLSVGNALKHGLIDQNMVYELSKLENNICKNTTPETFENCSHEVSQEPAEFADGDKFSEHAVPYSDLINGSSIDMQSGKRYLDLKTCTEAEYTGQNVQLKKSGVDFESNIIQIGNQEHNESDRSSPSHDNKPSEPNTFKNTSSETEDTSSLCSSLNHTDYLKERVDSIKIETEMFMSHTSDSGSLIRKEKCKEENFMDAPAHSIHCYLNVAESVNTGFCQAEMDSLAERDRESTSDVSNDLVNASPSTQIKYEVQDNRDNLEVNTSMTEACTDPQVENGTEVKAFIVRNQYLQDDFKIRSDMSNHIQGGAMDQLLDSSEKTILRDSNDSVNSRVVTGDICTERKSMDANVDLSTQFTDSVGKLTVQSDISSITDSSASESVQTSDVCSKLRSSLQELVKITVEDTNAKVLQKAESQVAEDIIKMIISIQECPTEENAVSHDEEKGPQLSDIHDKSPDVFTDLLKQEFLHSKADEQLGAKKDLALKEKMHETNPAAAAELFQSQLQQVQLAASLNDDPAMFKELAGKLSDILGGNLECERNQTPGSARGDRSKQVAAAVNETLNSDEPEFCNLTETIKALSKQEKVEQVSADLCEDTQSPQNKTETKGEPKSNGATQHHLKCIGKLQDHSEVLELLKNKLDSLEPLGNNLDTLTIQLEESELLESQLSSLAGTLTKDLKTADQLLESANEYVPMQIRCDLEMVSKNVQLAFSDACKMSTERRHLVKDAIYSEKSKLAYSNQELLERVQKLSVCIEESAGSITNLDIMNTDDMETVELRIQQNKDLDKALSITKNQLDATAFDVQYFISEHAQDLSPTQSKLLLKSLNAAQKSFKELMEVVLTQQDTLMLHLEIRQDLSNQKNVAEKQKEYTEKLQELCHHLTQTENRLIGHQQTTISGDSLGDLQQFQTEHQALQRDVQAGDSALTEVVRCTKKFLEENRGKLQPEQIAMIENKLEEANSKSKLINQRAEESRKDLDKAMTTAIKQETEKVAAVKQLEESKNKIEGLLGWLSNVGKEKDMEGNVEQQVAKQNGNLPLESTDTLMIVEEDEANGNLQQVQTGTVVDGKGKATEELDLNKEYDKVKAHHQEILSQQPDFIIATQSAQALLEKQGHMLSPEEKEKLQRNIQELKDCYETTLTKTEHKMKQIHSVQEELQKFKTDCSEFENWLQQSEGEITDLKTGAPDLSVLNGKLQRQRSFSEDVISHKGDLRFITISGQRVLDAAKSCSKADTSKDSELDIDTSGVCTVVQDKLDSAANRYKTLHSQCNQLGNNLKDVVEKYKQYEDASTGLGSWLAKSEEVARKQLAEPVAADPKNLQKQLEETKALQGQMSGRQGAVEKLRKTADALTATEGDLLTNQDTIQETVDDIVERYDNLSKAVSDRNEKLQITLTRSLSVQDGLDEMLTWMEGVEKSLGEKDQVPLNSTAIQDILSKKAVLEQDFSIRQSSITAMKEKVKKFIETADPSTASSLQAKMDTLSKCFTDSCKKHKEKVTKLEELKDKVELFEKTAQKVQQFVAKRSQALSETDGPGKNVNELSQLIQDTNAELSDYAKDVELLRNLSKELAEASPEGSNVRILEKVDNLSKKFKEFEDTFKEKEEEVSSCQGQLAEFKCAVESFRKWLDESTEKIPVVKPACSVEDHQKHLLKAKALLEEWLSKASMLQEINNKGSALCNLISVLTSPVKTKTTVKSGTAVENDAETHAYLTNKELTVVQQNMSYVNHGYEILGVHLKENVGELDGMLVKLREVQDEANSLMQWFDDINKTTSSWDAVPTEAESMKTQMEQQKTFEAELKQKQGKLKQLKEKLLDLLEKHPDSPEAAKWKQMLNQIDSTWKDINSSVDERKQKLEESSKNLTQFQTAEAQLKQWLAEKELMMSVLGPLSIDPNMLNAQKQQVQILQNEFDTRKSQYHQLKESAQGILERPGDLPPSCKVLKDQLAAVAEKWENLTGRLSDRSEQIDQAIVKTNEFQNLLKKISENVDVLNSKLNSQSSLSTQPDAVKQQLETANEICTKLGEEKKNVEEAEVLCKELSALVCEEYLKTDLSRQLESVKKPFKDLEERTGNRIQQLNSAFASSQQFHQMSKDFHGWLDGKRQEHSMSPLISAELETLQQTIKEHAEFQKSLNEQNAAYEIIIKDGETLLQKTQGAEKSALQSQLALLKANWDELKKQSSERQDKLQGCLQRAQKYKQHVEKLRPWIEECENKVAKVKICIDPAEVERSISEVKTLQKDLDKHRGMVELLNTAADSLFEVSQADEDLIRDEKASFNQKVDNMTEQLQNKKDSLEEIAQRLKEFNESHKEAKEQLYGAKQQLEAHESLGAQAYSNKHLTNMKAQQKTLETLKTQVDYLKNLAQGLVVDAPDAAGVSDLLLQTDSLNQEYNSVNQQVEEKCSFLETKLQGIGQFQNNIREMFSQFADFDDELDSMQPVARDLDTLQSQKDDMKSFVNKLQELMVNTVNANKNCKKMLETEGSPDLLGLKRDLEALNKQCSKLMDRAKGREELVETTLIRVDELYKKIEELSEKLQVAKEHEESQGPVGMETEIINQQLDVFKVFQKEEIEPLQAKLQDVNWLGQGLIQSAAKNANTQALEGDLEDVTTRWNTLNKKVAERDTQLHEALLHCGRFQDALESLLSWLNDTEDLVANQKPPSAEFKVVKAQIQEQKLLQRLLDDRKPTVDIIKREGEKLSGAAEPADKEKMLKELGSLDHRWDALLSKAETRHRQLESILVVAQQFHETLEPLAEWLSATEKRLANSEPIGTQTKKLEQQISQHKALEDDIMGHSKNLHQAISLGQTLKTMSSMDDKELVQGKLDSTQTHAIEVQERCSRKAVMLQQALSNAQLFGEDEVALMNWLNEVHDKLSNVAVQDYNTDVLHKQHYEQLALHEDIVLRKQNVHLAIQNGLKLLKQTTGDEVVIIQEKLDGIKARYAEVNSMSTDVSKSLNQALTLATKLQQNHEELCSWLDNIEAEVAAYEVQVPAGEQLTQVQERQKELLKDAKEHKRLVDTLNEVSSALLELVPWRAREGLDKLVCEDNERYRLVSDSIMQHVEEIAAAILRSQQFEHAAEVELEWLTDAEKKLASLGDIRLEQDQTVAQLQVQKAFSIDILRHKDAIDEIVKTGEAIISSSDEEEKQSLQDKVQTLLEKYDAVSHINAERYLQLERAQSLASQFWETYDELWPWLQETRSVVSQLPAPAIEYETLKQQEEELRQMRELIAEHKPHIDKMNKTGPQLLELSPVEGLSIQEKYTVTDKLFMQIKEDVKQRAVALDEAISKSTQFHDKIDPMMETLGRIAERLRQPPSISVEVEKIREQISENKNVSVDLEKLQPGYETLKQRGEEMIARSEGADKDISAKAVQDKLDHMVFIWEDIQALLEEREAKLLDVMDLAEKFWFDHCALIVTIKDTQDLLRDLEEPGTDPSVVKQQQESVESFKEEIDGLQEELDVVQNLADELMAVCGEPDKPVIKKSIDELNSACDNLNKNWKERVEILEEAMQSAVQFQDGLQGLFDWVDIVESKLDSMSPVGTDLETVKQQIGELKEFKLEAYQLQIEMERLNQQAEMLLKKVVDENDRHPITEPLTELRMLWDSLDQKIINRQHKLEGALLALGQFQHALDELLTWLTHTEDSLKEQKKTGGDPKAIEIELAKHHVLQNDVLAHKTTVEAVEKAGNDMIESSAGEEASSLQSKLENLNQRWKTVLEKTGQRQQHLESALLQAQGFHGEIEDMQKWLKDTERQLLASKAVGGLPETAREQLNIHLELLNVFEAKEEQYISLMQKGQQLITICPEGHDANTEQDLKNLKEKWESVQTKTTERKVKLEEALTLATQFHNSLQDFINWLTQAEQTLTMATPASLILDDILFQIDEHKVFVTEVNCHREQIIELDKTGTHLKYFSQKQDVVLIKNLLISVQSRWEKVVQRSVERGRALDDARKRAKQFHEAWNKLMEWLEESEKALDSEQEIANDPDKIKMQLAQHKDFQKALGGKHSVFDTSIRTGRSLKEKTSLKDDNQKLDDMLSELRDKWDTVCGKSVERQNKLEEALLFSGHFTDALQALIDWLYKVEPQLAEDQPVHGDIDLVLNLIDNHKVFQKELGKRTSSVQALKRSARELTEISHDDSSWVKVQMQELSTRWETVCALSVSKQTRLEQALCQAEEFHSTVHILLEWLAEAEQSLRFHGALPDDEEALCALLDLHKEFMRKLEEKRVGLSKATGLGEVILTICHPDSITTIKHWNTIIKARFEEVLAWAKQHQHRLGSALKELLANRELLETLLGWLQWAETTLNEKDKETIPQQIEEVKTLIAEHQTFMEEMTRKQPNVDKLTKTYKRRGAAEPPPIQSNIPVLDKGRGRRKRSPMQRMYPSSTNTQIETKNPRVNLLVSKWQQVWLLALDRRRKLNDALDRLEELREFANFDFDIWRKRYMRWMNHKKSRVMDFFRRIDKDQDGKITRQEFIDGILSSKFPTSRLEMSAVADIFDRDGDGYIDYYEFVAALHPNKDAYKPLTDADKIEDEVTRQVAKCKCPKRFQVEQIGANKYRFGDSQQLRLVRILRSTVMVRVGGGWMALDEFLVKNDPCRAKGRTNMELREKFILPEGVTQIIGSFRYRGHKSRPSSRAASPNRSNSSHCCVSVPPTPNLTTTSTPKNPHHITRNYDKPWLTNSKTSTPVRSSESPECQVSPTEGTPIQGSKLRLPGYLSGKGFHAGEESSLITAAASKARTQSAETKKTPSRPGSRAGSKAGSRASSRRGSDASDFDISEILSVCSDMSETVPDSNKTGPRAGHRPSSAKPSKIPTPQRRSPAASKLAKASKR
ncbi:dystonin-like isoform X26 [Acipenser ruthenus]|uniref:dystonin-like isoform X26 n=1 Tax=Acipenser ruthenus TaxID=7906 RepID=UPI00274147D8|nr:dystonin-like isoform X26 [Acipenser ruthenus]